MRHGSCAGALCRVAKIAPGNRVALVVHLKPGTHKNPDFLKTGQLGLFCKENHSQPCQKCDHVQSPPLDPLEVIPVEIAQVYFIARGPSSEENPTPPALPATNHLAGPLVAPGGDRYVLPDPDSVRVPLYGTTIPAVDYNHPDLQKYESIEPDRWMETNSHEPKETPPRHQPAAAPRPPLFPNDEEDSGSDAEIEPAPTQTRSGRQTRRPNRLGYNTNTGY